MIAILRPTGAGSLAEWTPSAGANWQCVAAPATGEVATTLAGRRDRYVFSDLPADATSVSSVSAYAMIGSSGTASLCRLTLDLAGVEDNGAPFLPAEGSYDVAFTVFATAPGGLGWTVARANALTAGPDTVDAPDTGVSVDEVWLAVTYESSVADTGRAARALDFGTNAATLDPHDAATLALPGNSAALEFPTNGIDMRAGSDSPVSLELESEEF